MSGTNTEVDVRGETRNSGIASSCQHSTGEAYIFESITLPVKISALLQCVINISIITTESLENIFYQYVFLFAISVIYKEGPIIG